MITKLVFIGSDDPLYSGSFNGLTPGKVYDGEWFNRKSPSKFAPVPGEFVPISIRNDFGFIRFYYSFLFKTLEEFRDEKIDRILVE